MWFASVQRARRMESLWHSWRAGQAAALARRVVKAPKAWRGRNCVVIAVPVLC